LGNFARDIAHCAPLIPKNDHAGGRAPTRVLDPGGIEIITAFIGEAWVMVKTAIPMTPPRYADKAGDILLPAQICHLGKPARIFAVGGAISGDPNIHQAKSKPLRCTDALRIGRIDEEIKTFDGLAPSLAKKALGRPLIERAALHPGDAAPKKL
jgi:hypothetical protein